MPALPILLTNDGYAAFTAAQLAGDIDLAITSIGLTDDVFVMAPTLTALPGEFTRIETVSGEVVDNDTVHLTFADHGVDVYQMRGFALFLSDGTLFAVYGQADPIVQKAAASSLVAAIDIKFLPDIVSEIVFGDANFLYPPATETVKGVAEIATQPEVDEGDDDERFVTPLKLANRLAAFTAAVTATLDAFAATIGEIWTALALKADKATQILAGGLVTGGGDLSATRTLTVTGASSAELLAATAADRALTPASFGGLSRSLVASGYEVLPGGRIEQWGTVSAPGAVTFPTSFPTACLNVVISPTGDPNSPVDEDDETWWRGPTSTTGFTISTAGPGATIGFTWRAIGN